MTRFLRNACERMYSYLPPSGQDLAISLYGELYKGRRLGGVFAEQVVEFKRRDRWSEDQMQSWLQSRLRNCLVHAWRHVPHYRLRWAQCGLDLADLADLRLEHLHRLPLTRKFDLRLDPDSFLAAGAAKRQRVFEERTSGSTGESVAVAIPDILKQSSMAAREVRSFGWAGTSMLLPRATIGGRMVVPRADSTAPYYRHNRTESQCYFSAFHISPVHVNDYLEGFHRYRPRVLTGYSSSYHSLAHMMLAQNLRLGYCPDALILSADMLTAKMKTVIQQAFRARPYEEYGSVENVVLATECEHGRLHVSMDFGIVEIVGEQGEPLPPGEEGRIVCTGLFNGVQPLIRYDIGDRGAWSTERCPCGRNHLPVLREIAGRLEDVVFGPDGREVVRVCSLQDLPHVISAQLVQERLDLVKVRVVATEEFDERDELLIRDTIATKRLGKVRVEIERVAELERTACGKVRRVISRLPPEEQAAVGHRSGFPANGNNG